MSKWMCDVKGKDLSSERKIEELMNEGITDESLNDFIGERGNLPTNVMEKIKEFGYQWSDSGGGCDSWHLGVPFDSLLDAVSYLEKMTNCFRSAIECGLLRFELKTWSKNDWKV